VIVKAAQARQLGRTTRRVGTVAAGRVKECSEGRAGFLDAARPATATVGRGRRASGARSPANAGAAGALKKYG
jgi:hypothetical protein